MKRWLFITVPLVILGLLIAWRIQGHKAAAVSGAAQMAARGKMAPVVSVAVAEKRDLVKSLEAVGTVEAPMNVKVSAEVSGRIIFLQAREGDRVRRGEVLVRIDASELRAQVAQRRAALAQEKHRLAQAQITQAPTDASVVMDVRQQEAALATARARLNQVTRSHEAQIAAAEATVTDLDAKISSAVAAIENAEAAMRSAQAHLENARTHLKRVTELHQQGYTAAQDVDDARTTVSVQQAALDVAAGQLRAAKAQRESAQAQKQAALKQVEIIRTKGEADIAAAQADVAQAEAALEYARANTARKPAYQQNLAALQASVEAAQASLENAQAQLAQTTISSPVDGFVTARHMDPGAVATPGQAILNVQEIQQVWVNAPVPEEAQRGIQIGQEATVRFDALAGRQFSGRVSHINPAADPNTRQFTVRVQLDNAQGIIKPGMFARVTIPIARTLGAVVVPLEAIQQENGTAAVMVVGDDSVAHRRVVKADTSDPRGVVVSEGLQPGEKVIILSTFPIRDGQEVRTGGDREGGGGPGGKGAGSKGAGGGREGGDGPGSKGSGGAEQPGSKNGSR